MTDPGIQSRVKINDEYVTELADILAEGNTLPPIEVFHDGSNYWIADGFHRLFARLRNKYTDVECNVRKGTKLDAMWASCAANQDHGLRRTNADKRHAVEMALKMKPELSDRGLADHVGVGHAFVSELRAQLSSNDSSLSPENRVGIDGRKLKAPPPPPKKLLSTVDTRTQPPAKVGVSSAPPPPPPKKRPVAELDERGKEIPENLVALWNRRGEVKEMVNALNEVKRVTKKAKETNDPLFAGGKVGRAPLHFSSFEAHIESAIADLKACYPVRVCPACKGETCRSCCGLGLISDFYLTTVPESIKK